MGFSFNPLKNPLERGVRKLAGKSPVLNKLPGIRGPAKQRAPIGPSPGVVNNAVARPRPAPADMSKMGARPPMGGPPPMQPPQMSAPPQMPPPDMPAIPMQEMAPPSPPQMPPQMPPQIQPQFDPNLAGELQRRMGGNTGITGGRFGRPSGIGPRFMG